MIGFGVGRNASVRTVLEAIDQLAPLSLHDDGARLVFRTGLPADTVTLPERDLGMARGERQVEQRADAEALPGEVSVAFLDPARDYQPGLQRARRAVVGEVRAHYETAATLSAGDAKRAAEQLLADAWTMQVRRQLRLPWRHARLAPGDVIAGDGDLWRVRGWTMEAMAVVLDLERARDGASLPPPADSGRSLPQVDAPHGDTVLEVLDLPPLSSVPPTTPRLWLAAGGASAGWRRAELLASTDGGATYEPIAATTSLVAMGVATTVLGPGPTECWDRRHGVEVELISAAMWLESRTAAATLAGANLALIGDELVQFASAVAVGPRRFRLGDLLRGRRGTESAVGGHAAGERFVLVDTGALVPFDAPASAIGGTIGFKALSPHQAPSEVPAQSVAVRGRALRPLAPVHLRASRLADGAIRFAWTRRSRQGFDWLDGNDAPLAEEREAYAATIMVGSRSRSVEVGVPWLVYAVEDQIADAGGQVPAVTLRVAQISALVGLGEAAEQSFDLQAA